jgi:hypothetical protein
MHVHLTIRTFSLMWLKTLVLLILVINQSPATLLSVSQTHFTLIIPKCSRITNHTDYRLLKYSESYYSSYNKYSNWLKIAVMCVCMWKPQSLQKTERSVFCNILVSWLALFCFDLITYNVTTFRILSSLYATLSQLFSWTNNIQPL